MAPPFQTKSGAEKIIMDAGWITHFTAVKVAITTMAESKRSGSPVPRMNKIRRKIQVLA
jgi:hypothetical protein